MERLELIKNISIPEGENEPLPNTLLSDDYLLIGVFLLLVAEEKMDKLLLLCLLFLFFDIDF